MKPKNNLLPWLFSLLGLLTLGLRTALYTVALDEKNLLLSGHPLTYLVWITAAIAALLAVVLGRQNSGRQESDYTSSPAGAVSAWVFGAAIGVTVFGGGVPLTLVEKLRSLLGMLCVPALAYTGVCRWKGKRPFFACHCVVCVFFTLYLVGRYRLWSGDPQLQDYVFPMLACVMLALLAYCQAARDADLGNSRQRTMISALATYLCIAALYRAENPALYLAGALWALSALGEMPISPKYRGKREAR